MGSEPMACQRYGFVMGSDVMPGANWLFFHQPFRRI